ncbi:MAG TPA: hypothetical protein VJN88_02040 [Ktedonobacterales bacterium]|nr:hypothetical protein [Ktedonobacterales bacterium]
MATQAGQTTTESARAGAVAALLQLRDELATAHPDISQEDSTELLRQARDERSQQLDRQ